jgi:signal transduction histidine kinase
MFLRQSRSRILLVIVYIAVVLISTIGPGNQLWSWTPHDPLQSFATSLPGIAGTALRFHRPRTSLLLALASAALTFALGFLLPFMLFTFDASYLSAVEYGRRFRRRLLVGAGCMTAGAVALAYLASGFPFATTMGFLLLICLWLPLFWGLDVVRGWQIAEAERFRALSERKQRLSDIQSAVDRADVAAAEERARLASDLHDTVSSRLAAISLQSQGALAVIDDNSPERQIVAQIRQEAGAALHEMTLQIDLLTNSGLDTNPRPTLDSLDDLIERSATFGQTVRTNSPPMNDLAPVVSALAYTVVHEILLNAAKHAPGSEVSLCWAEERDCIRLNAANAMPSANPQTNTTPAAPPGNQLGLQILDRRVTTAGGTFTAGVEESLWRVTAIIPRWPVIHTHPRQGHTR